MLAFNACTPGTIPIRMPVITEIARVKPTTRASIATISRRGMLPGLMARSRATLP